jgi:hypothetical protein
MNCSQCRELLVPYIEGLLDGQDKQLVEAHLKKCPSCKAEAEDFTRLHNSLTSAHTKFERTKLETNVSDRILKEQTLKLRKIAMLKTYTKRGLGFVAAATIMIGAIGLFTVLFQNSATTAYALEQTIQACHSMRYLHIKDFWEGKEEPKEFWLEFDESGKIRNIRALIPEWESPADGAKEIVWNNGKAEIWFKKKNKTVVVPEQHFANMLLAIAVDLDPKLAVQHLQEMEKQGKVRIEVNEPVVKTEPIVITATYLDGSPKPQSRQVLLVDQATKLVVERDQYVLSENSNYKLVGREELWDYNQEIQPTMFTLQNLPSNVVRVDQTAKDIGLAQGQLSNEQIAQEVARQFLEALIAMEYDKAGKLLGGMPADSIRKILGNAKVLRIVSLGTAAPHPNPETQGLIVPSVIEIEKDGKIFERKLGRLGVRPVYNQPSRWNIFGGIDETSFEPNVPNDYKSADEQKSPPVEQKLGRELTEAEKIEQPKVKETAKKLFQACTDSDWDAFEKLFPGTKSKLGDRDKIVLHSFEIRTIGEPYKKDDSGIWYVPYQFTGEGQKRNLRVRYDQVANGFVVCGGL